MSNSKEHLYKLFYDQNKLQATYKRGEQEFETKAFKQWEKK